MLHSRLLRILNLGAGVQSSCVLLKALKGELPPLDHAIFADTDWEPRAVYENLAFLKREAATAGLPLHVVRTGDLRADFLVSQVRGTKEKGKRCASIPLRTLNPDGSQGMIRRQCTREYKIDPIRKKIRELLGYAKGERITSKTPLVEQWFGIGIDEAHRMSSPDKKWTSHVYPLIDLCDPMLGRAGCFEWLEANYPGRVFPRSACIGCPYRSNAEFLSLPDKEFADAVEVDNAARSMGGMLGEAFLHRSCTPLATVDLGKDQMGLWGEECGGHCGV